MPSINPQPLSGGSYRQQLWDSIRESEGEVSRVPAGLWPGLAAVFGALIGAAFLVSSAHAQQGQDENVVYYEGDPEFCPRLLREADKVEYVEPIMPPAETMFDSVGPFARADDPGGPHYPKHLYFIEKLLPVPWREMWKIFRRDDWRERLFEPGNAPPKAETFQFYHYNVYDPTGRWRALNAKCPDFLIFNRDVPDSRIAPDQFALYDIDLDNDGASETILYRTYPGVHRQEWRSHYLHRLDFATCENTALVEKGYENLRLIRFEGRTYIEGSPVFGPNPFIALHEYKRGRPVRDSGDLGLCTFHEIRELSDFTSKHMSLKPKEW